MSILTIRHKRHWYEPKLPHSVFLNGYFVGMMKRRLSMQYQYFFDSLLLEDYAIAYISQGIKKSSVTFRLPLISIAL